MRISLRREMTGTKAMNLASKWKVDMKDLAPRRGTEPIGYNPGGQLVIQTAAVGSGEVRTCEYENMRKRFVAGSIT